MGIQIIASKASKEIGAFENMSELREWQIKTKTNIKGTVPGMEFVWKIAGTRKTATIKLVQDSELYDIDYLAWIIDQKNRDFPCLHGKYYIQTDIQSEARQFVEERCNKDVILHLGKSIVSLDFFVEYCYNNEKSDEMIVEWNKHKCHIKPNTTPELAIQAAIRNLEHLQDILDDPLKYDEYEIETCYYIRSYEQ